MSHRLSYDHTLHGRHHVTWPLSHVTWSPPHVTWLSPWQVCQINMTMSQKQYYMYMSHNLMSYDHHHMSHDNHVTQLTLFPCGVNRMRVTPGPAPALLWTDTAFSVPNSNILTDPSAEPVRSAEGQQVSKAYQWTDRQTDRQNTGCWTALVAERCYWPHINMHKGLLQDTWRRYTWRRPLCRNAVYIYVQSITSFCHQRSPATSILPNRSPLRLQTVGPIVLSPPNLF